MEFDVQTVANWSNTNSKNKVNINYSTVWKVCPIGNVREATIMKNKESAAAVSHKQKVTEFRLAQMSYVHHMKIIHFFILIPGCYYHLYNDMYYFFVCLL